MNQRNCAQRVLAPLMLFSAMSWTNTAYATAGDLDSTFGIGGKVVTTMGNGNGWGRIRDIAVQSDGKILVAGESYNANSSSYDFTLMRYNSDGTLDTSFGEDGKQVTDFNGSSDTALALALQSDGKIIVVGVTNYANDIPESDFALARYNSDGTLDTSFSDDGKQTTDFNGLSDIALSVAMQSNGKFVVAGRADIYNSGPLYDSNFAVARYNSDGTLDTAFSEDGKQTTDFITGFELAFDVAVQSDGKIIVVGSNFDMARYNSDGTLDTSFSGDGKQTTDFNGNGDFALDVALQSDGKILVAGRANDSLTGSDFALARYNSDGTLDVSFSGDGRQTTDFSNNYDEAWAMVLQSDGKIVLAGEANISAMDSVFALVRYKADGSLDTTFSGDGKQTTNFNNFVDEGYATALQGDGKIVVAGYTSKSTSPADTDFALARYLSANPTSSSNSSVNGAGFFKGEGSSGQASFWAANNRNGMGGNVNHSDTLRKVNITSTQIDSIQVEGNTARVTGTCKFNGVSGYTFVLTAYDYSATFFGRGDSFTIEVPEIYSGGGTFTRGDVKVVASPAR